MDRHCSAQTLWSVMRRSLQCADTVLGVGDTEVSEHQRCFQGALSCVNKKRSRRNSILIIITVIFSAVPVFL